ncbi:MAG: CinA family protein, partial [Alphaproteobacteria bacterium]|nr:CinA family protein [Alphaproteobacteria bacterium]
MARPKLSTESLAQRIITKAADLGIMLATAESCTGGMIAAALTDIAGSSVAVDRGFITYSNAAKTESLDVPAALIADHGAVS